MTNEEKFRSLTNDQMKVLYWKYQDFQYDQIAIRIVDKKGKKRTVQWVQGIMTSIYDKFDIPKEGRKEHGWDNLKPIVTPLLIKYIGNDLSKADRWQPLDTEVGEESRGKDKGEEDKDKGKVGGGVGGQGGGEPPVQGIPVEPSPPRPRRFTPATVLLIIIGLCILIGLCARCVPPLVQPLFNTPAPTTTPTLLDTPTPIPSATPSQTLEPTFPPTDTPVPTDTPLPTDTPIPTDTPVPPTITPLPTVPPVFFDNFDAGLSNVWQKVFGDYAITNGILTTTDKIMLSIPNNWTDYEVSFDVSHMFCQGGVSAYGTVIGMRYQDVNNMVQFNIFDYLTDCLVAWVQVKDGKSTMIPNSTFRLPPTDSNGWRHIVIDVQGNKYSSPIGSSVVITAFPSGGVSLQVDQNVEVDNFKVTLIGK